MMSNMMTMMQMMGQPAAGTGDAMSCMAAMTSIDHVEGWLAFLRTELKITEAQHEAWGQFAESTRKSAQKLADIRKAMMKPAGDQMQMAGLQDKLGAQEQMLDARLQHVRAFKKLYGALTDDQKKAAEELLMGHTGTDMGGMMTMGGP
jgi:hypothetical protein